MRSFIATLGPAAADTGSFIEAAGDVSGSSDETRFAPGAARKAAACLHVAFPGFPGTIAEVRRATFQGEPAFLATVVESARFGAPVDAVTVWVAAAGECSSLSLSTTQL